MSCINGFFSLTIIVLLFTHSRVIILICVGMRILHVIKHDCVFKGADLSDSKESAYNAGDLGLGRFPGEGKGNPLQYSPMDRGACPVTVRGLTKSQT